MNERPLLQVAVSSHIHQGISTANMMWMVCLALAPAALWGVYVFGWYAAIVLLVSIVSSVLTEFLLGKVSKQTTIQDGSAILTGLLVGMNMPPAVPLFVPILASMFAIAVVKWSFGGLGANWMNPALGGRAFVVASFSSAMGSGWLVPRTLAATMPDSLSGATPLMFVKTLISTEGVDALSSASVYSSLHATDLLSAHHYPVTGLADKLSGLIGRSIPAVTIDSFLGNVSGCIGEVSTVLLLAGGIFLIAKKIISWHIPVIYIGFYALLNWIFGGLTLGMGFFSGDVLLPMFSGGLFLGAIFMATDMVTSPVTNKGRIIFAASCGFFTFLFRNFSSLPDAVSYAILLMNIVTPTIDRYVKPKLYGAIKKQKEAAL